MYNVFSKINISLTQMVQKYILQQVILKLMRMYLPLHSYGLVHFLSDTFDDHLNLNNPQ